MNIQAAKTHLSRLVEEAVAGEEIVLAKAGKPLVRLVPYRAAGKVRKGGQLAGQIEESPDCWENDELEVSISSPLYDLEASKGLLPRAAEKPSGE